MSAVTSALAAHPYAGAPVALATRHGKERAVAPALARTPGLRVVVPPDLDTDRLGTFTGEVSRPAPPAGTALLKARLGIAASGLPRAVASEGAFGPHPHVPFVPVGLEVLGFVDEELGVELTVQLSTLDTTFAHIAADRLDDRVERFLATARFGTHAMVVRPHLDDDTAGSDTPGGDTARVAPLHKGIASRDELAGAIERCARASADGLARIETDMRAHRNPTRMRQIALLARHLADRLSRRCPACDTPGFGTVDTLPGLPCATCRVPTAGVAVEVEGCSRCAHRRDRPRADGIVAADPADCPCCNP